MTSEEFAARAQRLRGRLFRTAVLYLGSEALALDAVDEAVYRGLCAAHRLRRPDYFDTWLTRILLNECAREKKRQSRLHPLDTLPETAAPETLDALPLRDAVRRLPEPLAKVVILRYFAGYTLAETAAILSIPQGTAATRQRRALALLRLELLENEPAKEATL